MASSHCWESPPALNPAGGVGEVVDDFGGLKAYVAGSAESKAALILVSDVFGFEAPKLRKIADNVALSGYLVVVPDFLHGDPFDPSNPNNRAMWLQAHSPQKAFEEAKPVIAALKEKGVATIGAAGYCWGAKVVVELAKVHEIQAAVLLHPSLLTVDDIKEIKCPISILGAEIDKTSPPELLKEFQQILSANSGIDHFVKIFPGVAHGWAVRYSDDDVAAVRSAAEALHDMTHWFNKYLK
ncbi:endo-1,3;1,4-beta-D-glucanase-like [Miscanthus floridulus]|uniref:endo-1,3;1,4-beta-D-glucanase-like n=1 Tax=Miscanthus floridulus TaxID=154761 RepID=UPI00345A7302